MSIESPVGTLDIKNATLRVGKLEVSNIQGIDTALNVTRAKVIPMSIGCLQVFRVFG